MNTEQKPNKPAASLSRGFLSLIIPGLGQMVAGAIGRGIAILATVLVLSGLTIYTAAQRARFPDYKISAEIFLTLLVECTLLLLFLWALYYLTKRYIIKAEVAQTAAKIFFVVAAVIILTLVSAAMINTVITEDKTRQVYEMTAFFGAASVAAIWLWNIGDAVTTTKERQPSMMPFILLLIIAILIIGSQVTQINLPKAIREYQDTQIILRRIFWPWQAAFDYEADDITAKTKVQAPCQDPAAGLQPAEPGTNAEPWVVSTPACGEVSTRDSKGNINFGTLLILEGGGFEPGVAVNIKWENPIGNAFTPRGMGDTEIMVDGQGKFTSELYVPDVVIPSTAQGAQVHTLIAYQRGVEKFSGTLSQEMTLALEAMLETIMMGLMATFAGIVISLPFSFLAARNLMAPIRSTLLGSVGGLLGLVFGGWVGALLARWLAGFAGGLDQSPILVATIYLFSLLGFAMLGFRLISLLFEEIQDRLPTSVSAVVSILGTALIGAALGYALGRGYALGILSIVGGEPFAQAMAPRTSLIGAIIGAGLFAFMAIRKGPQGMVPTGQIIYAIVRTSLNIVRSIEPLIWALVGVIWIGPGPFAGFIALTIHSVAALGKLYSEAIESISEGPIEALQASGANRLQTIVYAVVPQVMPPFISFTIYRWDINVRMSTVIGLVGGGGIGFLLIQWIRQFQYEAAGIAVWLIAITVAILDYISANIRERFV